MNITVEQAVKAIPHINYRQGLFGSSYGMAYTIFGKQDCYLLTEYITANLPKTETCLAEIGGYDPVELEDETIIKMVSLKNCDSIVQHIKTFRHYTLFWYDKRSLEGIADLPEWIERV